MPPGMTMDVGIHPHQCGRKRAHAVAGHSFSLSWPGANVASARLWAEVTNFQCSLIFRRVFLSNVEYHS